jgi:hypothetical protein
MFLFNAQITVSKTCTIYSLSLLFWQRWIMFFYFGYNFIKLSFNCMFLYHSQSWGYPLWWVGTQHLWFWFQLVTTGCHKHAGLAIKEEDVVHLPTMSTLWTTKKHLFQFKESKHFHQRNQFTEYETSSKKVKLPKVGLNAIVPVPLGGGPN